MDLMDLRSVVFHSFILSSIRPNPIFMYAFSLQIREGWATALPFPSISFLTAFQLSSNSPTLSLLQSNFLILDTIYSLKRMDIDDSKDPIFVVS